MQEEAFGLHLTADQCRQRAKLVRNFAKGVSSGLLRQDLLDIAAEYERRAESAEANTVAAAHSEQQRPQSRFEIASRYMPGRLPGNGDLRAHCLTAEIGDFCRHGRKRLARFSRMRPASGAGSRRQTGTLNIPGANPNAIPGRGPQGNARPYRLRGPGAPEDCY